MSDLLNPVFILTADECRSRIVALPDKIEACDVLWDRCNAKPVYVGTARNKGRIRAHLLKDSVRDGKIGLTHRNRKFFDYVNSQPVGWLAVTFDLFETKAKARVAERAAISKFGIRRDGGSLFNRQMSG